MLRHLPGPFAEEVIGHGTRSAKEAMFPELPFACIIPSKSAFCPKVVVEGAVSKQSTSVQSLRHKLHSVKDPPVKLV